MWLPHEALGFRWHMLDGQKFDILWCSYALGCFQEQSLAASAEQALSACVSELYESFCLSHTSGTVSILSEGISRLPMMS